MKAFHGKIEIKEKYLKRVRAHREADQLVKGTYWDGGKGCAVGCTVHSNSHKAYEIELGIPDLIARLEDGLFERLPNGKSMEWPEKFLSTIPVGADLSKVGPEFILWLLSDEKEGILRGVKDMEVKEGIEKVVKLYQKKVAGIEIAQGDWLDARTAIASLDALDALASSAALDALDALASSASRDGRYKEERERVYIRMSKKLLELLRDE